MMGVMVVMMMVVMVNLPLMWIISLDMSDVVSRQLVNCSLNIQISLNHIFCIVSSPHTIQSNTIIAPWCYIHLRWCFYKSVDQWICVHKTWCRASLSMALC